MVTLSLADAKRAHYITVLGLSAGAAAVMSLADLELAYLLAGGGGGAHPDLAAHNTLGLATQAELDATQAEIDALETLTAAGIVIAKHKLITLLKSDSLIWTDQPAALTEFPNTHTRTRHDASGQTEARLHVNRRVAGVAGATMQAQWATPAMAAWDFLDGVSGPSVAIDGTGLISSGWITLMAGAKADIVLRAVGQGGNSTTDPRFDLIAVEYR